MLADWVFRGGRVFTPGFVDAPASGVAIADGHVVAVGPDHLIQEYVSSSTEVFHLDGGLVTPGFIDAHVHPASSGLDQLRCSFEGCADQADAVRAVREYARAHPGESWILGAGWSMSWFEGGCPSRELADAVVSDRPLLLWNADGHGAWANTRALEVAGVTRDTADPSDGRIERLPDGSPQGTLHEGAVALVESHAPENTVNDYVRGLLRGQRELLRFGVTGWQDAAVTRRVQEAYVRLAHGGQLIGRAVGALWWDRHRGLEQIEELVTRREESAPGFEATSVKLMLDGVAENFTASVLDPWLDAQGNPTDNLGTDFLDPVELREIVAVLDAKGFQCHFHALGDRAVRYALDAVEVARSRNGANDNRHHLAHVQFVHPDDIDRFARLDVVANVQPLWACNDDYQVELTRPFITQERYSWQYPFGALLRSGARMAMGSDWGVSTANVLAQVDVAVNRTCPDGEPLGPEHALTAVDALTAFTAGSAYLNHAEHISGGLSTGMLADLVVLDRNPLQDGPIRDTEVLLTMVGGTVVYERN